MTSPGRKPTALLLAMLLSTRTAIAMEAAPMPLQMQDTPPSGWLEVEAERSGAGVRVSGVWMQTGSARVHYLNRVRMELVDGAGRVLSSDTAEYRPRIRSYGRRDKVWVLEHRIGQELPADARMRITFLRRDP